jgi:hypothetical protein
MATGGDILEITYNNPNLGSGVFYPQAGTDSSLNTGGVMNTDDMAMIDGSGAPIRQMTNTRWKFNFTSSWDMNSTDEVSLLKALAADTHPDGTQWTVSIINGTTWAATGFPVGDIEGNTKDATVAVVISGGGKMKKIIG